MLKYIIYSIYLSMLMSSLVQCKEKNYKKLKICDPNTPDRNECLAKAIQSALRNSNNDNETSIGQFFFAPLYIDKVQIKSDGLVNIDLQMSNLTIYGINDSTVENADTDWEKMIFVTEIPKLVLNGTCKINGKILSMEINGDGPCKFELTDMKTTNQLTLKIIEKDNKKYYEIISFELDVGAESMTMNFSNLCDGNQVLGNQTNQFLNENWKTILQALNNESLTAAFGPIFKDIGNKVFSKVPKDKINPSENSD